MGSLSVTVSGDVTDHKCVERPDPSLAMETQHPAVRGRGVVCSGSPRSLDVTAPLDKSPAPFFFLNVLRCTAEKVYH